MNRTLGWLMIRLVNLRLVRTPVWNVFNKSEWFNRDNKMFSLGSKNMKVAIIAGKKNNNLTRILYFLIAMLATFKTNMQYQNQLPSRWISIQGNYYYFLHYRICTRHISANSYLLYRVKQSCLSKGLPYMTKVNNFKVEGQSAGSP